MYEHSHSLYISVLYIYVHIYVYTHIYIYMCVYLYTILRVDTLTPKYIRINVREHINVLM